MEMSICRILLVIVLTCLKFSMEQMITSFEKTDVETILQVFCSQKHRLKVMECVFNSTQGQALEPWNECLNPEKELSQKETANLACNLLLPDFKQAMIILSECVEEMVSYYEAETWISVFKLCSHKIDCSYDAEKLLFGNIVLQSS
ncbi:hypothetical protein JTE90_019982 [Oedothorax gibbosus]|uniref:DUF19 domain-containing protein n=1 Tax=Oedothorax gibbosus TaxID=931172 RepID=A0AAV6UH03_9ARAC|nr:hypothetical protein JTE90_019982 [Oedothorax gibbosus]